jgi:hypothetical protein
MVPENKGLLGNGGIDGGLVRFRILVRHQHGRVLDEHGVEMSGRRAAGDLAALDQQNVRLGRGFLGEFMSTVVVGGYVLGKWLVFDVVADADGIEALLPRFLNPDARPHQTVGEHRVHVEVALQGFEALNVWDLQVDTLLGTTEFLEAGDAVVLVGRQRLLGAKADQESDGIEEFGLHDGGC